MSKDNASLRLARLFPAICILLAQWFLFGCEEATPKDTDDGPQPTEAPIQTVIESVAVDGISGVFRPGAIPAQSGGPSISLSGDSRVIDGGAFFVTARSQSAAPLDTLIVGLHGEDRGYYEVDLSKLNSLSHGLAATTSNQGTPYRIHGQVSQGIDDDFSIVVIASDVSGVGTPKVHDFELVEAGTGGKLNPPTWIHGTWRPCTVIPDSTQIRLTFSATTVVQTEFDGRLFDFSTVPGVSDSQGTDWYQIEMEAITIRFTQDGQGLKVTGQPGLGDLCRAP